MNSIAICIPAIIDLNLISSNVKSIKKNFIDCNQDYKFNVFVNIDDYKRPDTIGTLDEISECYNLLNSKNCDVDVTIASPRLGINKSYKYLLNKFINSNSDYCVFFDDDHEILNPVPLKEFYHKLSDDYLLRLSVAKKEPDVSFSYETPFLQNDIFFESKNVIIYKNNRPFFTNPGTFLSKNIANGFLKTSIFDQSAVFERVINSNIGIHTYTCCYKTDDLVFNEKAGYGDSWPIPLKNHFGYDGVRAAGGNAGSQLKDYN